MDIYKIKQDLKTLFKISLMQVSGGEKDDKKGTIKEALDMVDSYSDYLRARKPYYLTLFIYLNYYGVDYKIIVSKHRVPRIKLPNNTYTFFPMENI